MRCQGCDYDHEGMPSLFNSSLATHRAYRRVQYRPEVDKDLCTTCWNAGREDRDAEDSNYLLDFEFDEPGYVEALPQVEPSEEDT